MMKLKHFFLTTAALLLYVAPATAAIKPCGELQEEIEGKLAAHKVKSYVLTVTDKTATADGKIVGSCENSSKKIMYIRQQAVPNKAKAKAPVTSPKKSVKKKEMTLADVSKRKAEDAQVEAIGKKVISEAKGIKPCKELKEAIEAKLLAHKVKSYDLSIVSKNAAAPGKVVGTCENSSKKIVYLRK